ncbi:hypothetical protein GUJ93_ZPchr0773g40573 [Zizania palustris]|uniref:RING-type E3 ubiquitin transferase n=1 Tax=Zizania palustris TaxID=103762 RepID=A0A8J5RQY7_ZIZPA|nr:hypothetical protein GUJ93_ZPchr0773g40573 [Zizania palustris]
MGVGLERRYLGGGEWGKELDSAEDACDLSAPSESFNRTGMNHPHQSIHNLPANLAVDPGFVFPSRSMDEGSRNENAGESARGFIKRKNAAGIGTCYNMDFSRLYEVSNVVDEHGDMRLDIDSMTYEELLALEEQIGDVNTGLAKCHILDKLKTSIYVPGSSCVSDKSSESSLENDACIICQLHLADRII